jgi:signal transduction histidine kinase
MDLAEVVREVLARLGEELAQARCPLTVEAPAPVVGRWDRLRLEQVVNNLVGNARRYGAGQPISVRVTASDELARIAVEDHGPGIAAEARDKIFRRYERAHTHSTQAMGGLGLGLYIVKQLVEAHGGVVGLESEIGRGSTFTVELPR